MNFWKASTIALTATLAAVGIYETTSTAHADDAPQPNMQAAVQLLEQAQKRLEAATDDKGGFRVKAIGNTKDAIENTKKGIQWDKDHKTKEEKDKK